MPLQPSGVWLPDLHGPQWDVFNCYCRALLVSGPRLSGKSWAVLHKIVRHMWETPDARVAMFTKVLKNSKDAGCWKNLHKYTIPEWIKANIGLVYTTKGYDDVPGPKVDGQTRTPFFRIRNFHGGESECMLFSLDDDGEAEAKLKEKTFSLIFFSELSNFSTRDVLSLSLLVLRMPHLTFEQQMWIGDTNPAEDGESSWIYEAFYIEPKLTYEEYSERQIKLGRPAVDEESFLQNKEGFKVIEIKPEQNAKLDPRQLRELKALYAYDPGAYARFVDGKWVFGQGDGSLHFRKYFRPNVQVRGNCTDANEDLWETILPSSQCHELVIGLDTGDVNHAAALMEKQMKSQYVPQTKKTVMRAHFTILDELVNINTAMSLEHFTLELMEMVEELEKLANRKLDLSRCYSDSSVTKYSAAADAFPAAQIEGASMDRLSLIGVPKPKHSVRQRVELLQQLLAFDRIRVSAHCFHTISMLNNLKKGKDKINFVLQTDVHKHIFDAITYALIMECAEELQNMGQTTTGVRKSLAVSIH